MGPNFTISIRFGFADLLDKNPIKCRKISSIDADSQVKTIE